TTENDNGEEEKKSTFKADVFNNYARFIADLISDKVIYSDELDAFLIVKSNTYEVIDDTNFALNYPVDNKHQINDFLEVMLEMYREHLNVEHGYNILPYTIEGNNWIYDCRNLEFRNKALQSNELYAKKNDSNASEIDTDTPKQFFDFVIESDKY